MERAVRSAAAAPGEEAARERQERAGARRGDLVEANAGHADAVAAAGALTGPPEVGVDPAGTVGALLEENPMWSRRDAENSVKNRLMLDVVRVARLLRTDRWNLQALVQDCPVPVLLLAATDDSALTDPDRSVLMNRLPPDHIAVFESGHTIHRERPALWLHHVLRFAESP